MKLSYLIACMSYNGKNPPTHPNMLLNSLVQLVGHCQIEISRINLKLTIICSSGGFIIIFFHILFTSDKIDAREIQSFARTWSV